MNHFIYIIPKTPANFQNEIRKKLWHLCISSLIKQTDNNWTALIIGKDAIIDINDNRFIEVDYEGPKEEKLQKATEHIITNNIHGDYIIRLDDDDIINPTILEKVSTLDFDLYVDKHQWFWHYESGKISNRVWHWFPNTCIHKRKHALTQWGNYAKGDFNKYKDQALLIENDHSQLHPFYKDKNVLFANKRNPVYVRTITSSSITAKNALNELDYLKRFGRWRYNKLRNFGFLRDLKTNSLSALPSLTFKEKVKNKYLNLRWSWQYKKAIKS